MCLAVPVQITKILNEDTLEVKIGEGNFTQIGSALLGEAPKVGDYTIIHAGFALRILDTHEAQETIKLFQEMATAQQVG